MNSYILSLDQGTTSSRAVLFHHHGRKLYSSQYEFPQRFPQVGWVEHYPEEILNTELQSVRDCIAWLEANGGTASEIASIGITNQRETTILWNKHTGKPVYPAIVWQCRRTAEFCKQLEKQNLNEFFRQKTGLLIDPYFSATKIRWILDNIPDVRKQAENGELLFGTVDSWLIWNLTGGKVHATDYSNASRTMLFNIHTLEWDNEILELLNIPVCILPEVRNSSGDFGKTEASLFGTEIPISGCAGDQQAALFGQKCFHKGDIKNTYGTGGFLLMNTGNDQIQSQHGLLTTIAWGIDKQITYALEGSVFISGAVIKWLRDELGIIRTAEETAQIAGSIPDNGGVYFVPAFVGFGTPYWNSEARGLICGLTRGTGRAHIIRAGLEAVAYQTADVIKAMEQDTGKLGLIKADGGASQNDFLMQFQADILNRNIIRPENTESTASGAAFLAGLHAGIWKNQEEINQLSENFKEFRSSMDSVRRESLLQGWNTAVTRSLHYA
ncbi:MAG: glycerol kinase GlpK [Oscillospiraceae bacterium]|nr:glycerol kinase GlpK [Oscillospiraceae bacterium]